MNADTTVFSALIMNNLQYIILVMTVMMLAALIVFININMKLTKMNKRYRRMMQGMEGTNLERLLMAHIDEVRQTVNKIDNLMTEYKRIDQLSKNCIQRIGIVRFNAFEDTGSDLSYAVALLDGENNGVVLSSIFGRIESRSYAKPIVAGQSSYFLTDEEKQALAYAMEKKPKN